MNTGNRITALRKAKKLSQGDLAKIAGVSREIIGRYERGEASPSIEVVRKIAEGLDVSLDYFILYRGFRDAKTGKVYVQ